MVYDSYQESRSGYPSAFDIDLATLVEKIQKPY